MIELNKNEVRVLGALMEKERTTPENYPLSLNALTNACNQKSNRFPVVSFSPESVVRALDNLRSHKVVWECSSPGSRVPKYRHKITDLLPLTYAQSAVIAVLLLRGSQTIGEIKGRTERLYRFSSVQEVESTLNSMIEATDQALITKLPRLTGQKDCRYMHLLGGEIEVEESKLAPKPEAATLIVHDEMNRLIQLEEEVSKLRVELNQLRENFRGFAKEFE